MQSLVEGFRYYQKNILPELSSLFQELGSGQNPAALFFGCSDSRFDPNLITSSLPGQIFVHRSVGNLIPPADPQGLSHGDLSEASAIEYAVEVLGIRDVVVFGHSACGAMKATLQGLSDPALTPNLAGWLSFAKPALERVNALSDSPLSAVDRLSQANVLVQMDHASTYPAVRSRLAEGSIRIHGAWFEVATGNVHYYFPDRQTFVPLIDRGE